MAIKPLPPLLVNQIAAGEVIERPASVVKELVENSLDGGAKRIDVAIEDGGREFVRVSDDGHGIAEEELALAVAPHATSKLHEPGQLAAIGTLGFRGEALASIASVSRLRLISRATIAGRPREAGAVIDASGDHVSRPAPAPCTPGTIVEVRDLFFNTPARRKFMRGAGTEFGHISDIISRIAMANHDVAFTLTHGSRKVIDLAPEASPRRRCIQLLGAELEEAMLEFEHIPVPAHRTSEASAAAEDDPSIWGLAGVPSIAKATSKFQYLCVNGRPIRDRSLSHAIKEAYRGLIPADRHPMVVALIRIDPALVDVNVHPAKSEVRFRQPSRCHGLVLHSLRQRLLGSDLTPSVTWHGEPSAAASAFKSGEVGSGDESTFQHSSAPTRSGGDARDHSTASVGLHAPAAASSSPSAFVDYFRRMDPNQKGFVYEQVKAAMAQDHPEARLDHSDHQSDAWDEAQRHSAAAHDLPPVLSDHGVLQVHKSYLVTQDDQGLIIIDQHALHERVVFEELRRRVLASDLESQRLLMPALVPASEHRLDLLGQLGGLLKRIGIEAEPIGPHSIGVHAFPSLLFEKKVDPAEFVTELLDRAEEGDLDLGNPDAQEAALNEVLNMMACKAAVKSGDHMGPQELAALLAKRHDIERQSSCPHGRPTTIRLTLRDLEKQFKRT